MAEVFKAKSFGVEGFEKVLVIKRILPELARSPEFVNMFIHEAKLAVRLSHANIVQVFDLGLAPSLGGPAASPVGSGEAEVAAAPDAYFMAMEFVQGFDLATLLARCRRAQVTLPLDMCVFIAAEVAKGLDHAHRRRDEQLRPLGIVHRDVSPQNVLLSLEGEVKVTDFGIAKARGALEPPSEDTRTRQLHGKFGYMSPEQARGEQVDARSDLFSLGVLLYECVAGVNPFSAPTTFETLRRVQAGEAPPVELLRPDAPPELVTIVQTAMAKDINVRYADAGRMYEAMLAFLYAQGSRYSAHDLAEFLARFRDAEPALSLSPDRLLDQDQGLPTTAERTPVEIPPSRALPLSSAQETGVRFVGIDRAASMGERREVTALAIDFSERNSDAHLERAATIIGRYGGRMLEREPHHLVALFGLGDPDGRDTEVATRCALVALRSMGGPTPPSAGVHTARIHVARDGEPTEDDRLSSLCSTACDLARVRSGKCAVSAPAMRQLRGLFDFEPIADATSSRPVTGSIVKDVRGAGEAYGRFVGRKDELRKLGEILAAATKRSARVLTIRGDHGVGKTRLLVEAERRLGKGGYNVGWYVATCPPRGREFPLSGIVCMLQVLCGLTEGDSAERILAVQPRLRALGLHDEDVAAILNALGASVPAPNANAKTALKNAFTRMVASLCEDKPHTFAWDAAHCMDEDSVALVEGAFGRLTQARVVFGFSARAGFSHALESSPGHGVIELVDLSPADAEALIAARLGVARAPEELVRFVRDRAGGHPQFIEELLKGLLDAEAVKVADKQVVSMRLVGQELALPKTLRGLVASRVTRLSPADRATLQAAAVLGDPVDATVLAQMLAQPMSSLEGSLAALKTREFLMHTGPSELRFTSPIIREVVVDALTLEASREMHAAAGNALEAVLGDKAAEHAARIATHLYESGDRERAARYFATSAERRLEGRQLEAAARDYARAIDLSDVSRKDPAVLAQWLGGLTNAVRLVRSLPEAIEMCDRVLARIDAAGDATLRVRARVDAGVMLCAIHKFDVANTHFAEAERVAAGDGPLAKTILLAYAELASRQGDFNRCIAMLERLHKIATVQGDRREEHKILLHRAQAHAGLGDRRSALVALSRAEQLFPADAAAACERQKIRALVDYFSRDFRAGVLASEKAIDMGRALGVPYEVAINLHNLGDCLVRLEDFPRAYGAIRQSVELCDDEGFERLSSQNRMFLAFLDGVAGNREAEGLLRQGISYAEANDFTWDVVNGRTLLAQLLQRRGEVTNARAEFERARKLARESGNRLLADDCDAALRAIAS